MHSTAYSFIIKQVQIDQSVDIVRCIEDQDWLRYDEFSYPKKSIIHSLPFFWEFFF